MKSKRLFFYYFFILIFLFFTFIFNLAKSYADTVFGNISNNFIRLHVVANSDSTEDQIVKYEVRDAILNYIEPHLKNANSKEDALRILNDNIDQIYKVSNDVLLEKNLTYPLNISIGQFNFPTKDYSDFILPEGMYDALKVDIGTANGQNWWCVMFPSICIVDTENISSKENSLNILKSSLDPEEFSIITKNTSSTDIKIKFKIIEIFENL